MAAIVLGLIVGANVLGDPHRLWGGTLVAPDPGDVRALEVNSLLRSPAFDAVFIGDSRCQRQEPAYVARLTGWRPFNACQSGVRVPQIARALDAVIERAHGRLRNVVVFLGPELFRPGAAGLADARRRDHLLSLTDVKTTLRVLAAHAGLGSLRAAAGYARDGHQIFSRGFTPSTATNAAIAAQAVDVRASWQTATDPAGWRMLRHLLERAGQGSRHVRVVVMPYNPALAIRTAPEVWRVHREFVAHLQRLRSAIGFTLTDAGQQSAIYSRAWFLDGLHLDFTGQRVLARRVFGSS